MFQKITVLHLQVQAVQEYVELSTQQQSITSQKDMTLQKTTDLRKLYVGINCIKLGQTATETYEMLKLAFGEDTRHRTQVSDFQNSELK